MIILCIHTYMCAKFSGVVHGDDMLPHSQLKEKMSATFSQSLGSSEVEKDLNFKMVLWFSALVTVYIKVQKVQAGGACTHQGVRNSSLWVRPNT